MKLQKAILFGAFSILAAWVAVGCSGGSSADSSGTTTSTSSDGTNLTELKGSVSMDGSSTVYVIAQAVAEEFGKATNNGVRMTAGESGTGGGFKKFVAGEIDIACASRPIEAKEIDGIKNAGNDFIELPVAFDGLSIVVNPKNTWATSLTVDELKKIWSPDSKINNWKDVRAGFPDKPMKLFGPGTDSGTFDYFTKSIVGTEKSSRQDYQMSEDDNTLVTGVAGDEGAMGYFGYAYYVENKDKLKIVPIDAGKGAIEPTEATIGDGSYAPLSRPLFIYVSTKAAERPEVKALIEYWMGPEGRKLVSESGYVALPDNVYEAALKRFKDKKTGTMFPNGLESGLKLEDLLTKS